MPDPNRPWEDAPIVQPAGAAQPWADAPIVSGQQPAPVDLRRPPPVSDEQWYQQTFGRPAPLNSPNSDYMTMTQLSQLRQQQDPEGATAWQQELQRMVGGGQSLQPLGEGVTPGGDFTTADTPGQRVRQALQPWGDEAAGLFGGLGALVRGGSFPEGYNNTQQYEQQQAQDFATAWPAEAGISRTAGAVASMALPAGAIGTLGRGASMFGKAAAGAIGAGAAGFGIGATETGGQPAEWLAGGARAMIPTAVVGGTIPAIAPLVARGLSGFIGRSADNLPTNSDLRTSARQDYDAARQAGVVMDTAAGSPYEDFALNLMARGDEFGVDSVLTPRSARALDLLANAASKPSLDIGDLMRLRQYAGLAARAPEAADAEFGRQMRDQIDDWLDSLTASDVASGNVEGAAAALSRARESWTTLRKVETIEDIQNRAQLRAQAMNDPVAAVQAEFRSLARNDREMARFSPEEQDAIRAIATGGGMGPLNLLAKFAPQNGFFSMLAAVQGVATGAPGLLALSGAGSVARGLRRGAQQRQIGSLDSMMRGGGAQATPGVGAINFAGQLGNLTAMPDAGQQLIPPLAQRLGNLTPFPVR